jgi:hypothetical protein
VFAANFEEIIRSWAHQRIPQPKFFKPYRGFAGKAADRKSPYITTAYAWRREQSRANPSPCYQGKNTGNFENLGPTGGENHQEAPIYRPLSAKFPVKIISE